MSSCTICRQRTPPAELFPAEPGERICQECLEISDILRSLYQKEYDEWKKRKESNNGRKTKKY